MSLATDHISYGNDGDEYENGNDSEYGKKTSIPETDEAMKPAAE